MVVRWIFVRPVANGEANRDLILRAKSTVPRLDFQNGVRSSFFVKLDLSPFFLIGFVRRWLVTDWRHAIEFEFFATE